MALMGDDNHDDVIARLNRMSADGKAKIAASAAAEPAKMTQDLTITELRGRLPDTLPGHWETAEGREMAEWYADMEGRDKGERQSAHGIRQWRRFDGTPVRKTRPELP